MKVEQIGNNYVRLTNENGKIQDERTLRVYSEVICFEEEKIYYKEVEL